MNANLSMTRATFNPARARDTARRLREGIAAAPLIGRETVKNPDDIVISSIGGRR